jgi:HSP20 family molecular chaperone IbpA
MKEQQRDQLLGQDKRHSDIMNLRMREMEKNFAAQDRELNREVAKLKMDWADKANFIKERMDDPFYQMIDRKSQFTETDGAYELRAYIPLHDKNAIKVIVQPDKISVQGNRSHRDHAETNERRLSSEKFESFREEFQFTAPIVEKGAIQSRDGDYVTVTIPKLTRKRTIPFDGLA